MITFLWLIVATLILISEILLGTIYLLAVFLGSLAATLTAYLSASLTFQCTVFGVITFIGVFIAWNIRNRLKKHCSMDNNLDKGQRVTVKEILEDGSAIVQYRGAAWKAYAQNGNLQAGVWYIDKVSGPNLILVKSL